MTTIQKNIEISENRHLCLDLTLPDNFPAGQAKVLIFISPDEDAEPLASLPELAGSLRNSSNFSGDPMDIQRKIRSDVW